MRVLITQKINGVQTTTDYTRYVVDGSISVEDSINVPTLTSFQLANIDNAFIVPKRSSYVQILSDIYSDAPNYLKNAVPGTNYTVLGTSQPWLPTDPNYPYTPGGASPGPGTSPTLIPVVANHTYVVTYVSGLISYHFNTPPFVTPNGIVVPTTPNEPGYNYISTSIPAGGSLVGGWVNSAGNLLAPPFLIGNGPITLGPVPFGAAYLSMGVNDYPLGDNTGSWLMQVTLSNNPLPLATGFVTTEPERTYLGLSNKVGGAKFNSQVYTYNILVSSDEWLLNCEPIPYIPAFVNQTDSQILAGIANALSPGTFNTSAMASGTLVPYYQYDPSQTWSDIAKTFADANRYHYKVTNKIILYSPFGDEPLGIAYDDQNQKEGFLAPLELKTGLVTVPPVNDCIVIGDVEPQANWDNYFVGDGFTSNFQLKHPVFDGTTVDLLQDDWTEATFTQGTWTVNDPAGIFVLADGNGNALGALNVVQKGQTGTYTPQVNAEYIQAQNGLELGGGLSLQHGSVTFNDTASGGGGIIGGIYGTSTFLPSNCLAGFGVTGQANLGTFTVVSVQVIAGNTQLVNLTINGTAPTNIQPGNVFDCSAFVGASFLNNTDQSVVSINQISSSQYVITAQGLTVYNAPYGPASDSGSIAFDSNEVITTASGAAGLVIQPIYNGQYVGPQIVTQINHQYLLQTWIGAGAQTRYTRPYTNLTQSATYGNQNLAASGTITWVVTDVFLGNYVIEQQNPLFGLFPAAPPPTVTKYSVTNSNLPPFALYCLVNAIDLNVSINYTLLSLPPQGYLTVQSLTGMSGGNLPWLPSQLSAPIVYQLGEGQNNQSAQVSAQGEAFALAFYTDDIPSVGARIRFQSWAAGQSVARVQDPIAIANEAAITGDSGIRSAIMTNLSPLPRTSAECEAAAGAAILDREYPQFQGTYTVSTIPYKFENLLAPSIYGYPMTGRFLYINSPVRAVTGQNFFINTVRTQVIEPRQEVLTVSLDYGPDLYLEKLLPAFLERDQNILTPTQTVAPPNPITLGQVLNAHLPTLDNAIITSMTNTLTGNYITVSLGTLPVTGCEVRSVDSGWGVADQGRVGLFTSSVFTLPRTSRDQTWFLRTLNGSQFSRFSKALRVVEPLIPSAPALKSANSNTIVFDYAGDVRDIYGLEVRAPGVTGIVVPNTTGADQISAFERVLLPSSAQVGNSLAVYQPPVPSNFTPSVGNILYFTCPLSSSFQGLRLITGTGTQSPATTTIVPTVFTPGTSPYVGFSNPGNVVPGGGVSIGNASHLGPIYVSETWSGFASGPNTAPLVLTVTASYNVTSNGSLAILSYSLDGGNTFKTIIDQEAPGSGGGTYSVTLPPNQDITKVQVNANCTALNIGKAGFAGTASLTLSNMYVIEGLGLPGYQYMSWYDNGFQPQILGIPGSSGQIVGQAQIVTTTAPNWTTISGSVSAGGVATVYTGTNHGQVPGNTVIISCAYVGLINGSVPTDGAIFCGQWQVINVPAANQLQFNLVYNPFPSGLGLVPLTGLAAQVPVSSTSQLTGIGGVLIRRSIFAPSDLVLDLTQPDIAAVIDLLEATTPGGRVTGLVGYFFNLTWDYSAPTPVPSFTAPALTGIIIDAGTQQVTWSVAQGQPSGYRVEVINTATTQTQNKFTVNHPYNPQLLTQFQMSNADFQTPVTLKITPFDAVGDGIPSFVTWPGGNSNGGGGGGGTGIQLIDGILPIVAIPQATVVQISSNIFTGDTGSGGLQGDVPPPPSGSAALGDILTASGAWAPLSALGITAPVVFGCTWQGTLTPNTVILHIPIAPGTGPVTFAPSITGAGHLLIAPASQVAIPVLKNGVQIGAMIFASTNNFATFTGSPVVFNPPTDYIEVILPPVQDSTASDLGFEIVGRKQFP